MRRCSTRLAVTLAAIVCLSACGGSTSGGSHPTGPAVVVGLINTEDAPVGSFPDLRRGAIVGEKYVNATYGGIAGERLELVSCQTTGTPESSQACANRLLSKRPVAVIGGVDLGAAASLPPLQSAGVPYVGGTPAATEALTSRGSYMLAGGTATEILGEVTYAVDTLHVTRLAVVYADVPGLLSQATALLKTIVRKKGVTQFHLFPVAEGTPDVAPALTAAAATHPDAVIAVFPAQSCIRIVQGVAAIGLHTRMMYPSFCAVDSVLAAGGATIDGSVFATGYTPYVASADPDVSTYLAAVQRYDPSLKPSLLSQAGFSDMIVLRQLLAQTGGVPTAAKLKDLLEATKNQPGFMSHPFTCDGKQIPLLGGLCNAYVQISVVADGRLQPAGTWIDTAATARLAVP